MLEHLLVGFQQALQWQTFLAMLVGEVVGILVGAAPGLTVTMAVSLMLPATFVLSPVAAMAMLLGVYTGGFMGNSIPAILIKIPGTPSAAATVFDGYALAQKGAAGKALGVSIIASLYGGLFSLICLVLIAPQLAKVALQFGSAEVFSLLLFGMSIICSFAQHSLVKGIISGLLGLMLVTVGLDPLLGTPRFTFGHVVLTQGVSLIPAMIGIFAVPQVLEDLVRGRHGVQAEAHRLAAELERDPSALRNLQSGIHHRDDYRHHPRHRRPDRHVHGLRLRAAGLTRAAAVWPRRHRGSCRFGRR